MIMNANEAIEAFNDGCKVAVIMVSGIVLFSLNNLVNETTGLIKDTRVAVREVDGTVLEWRGIPGKYLAKLDPWIDCRGNGNCWQAQVTATLGATRHTMGQLAKAAPEVSNSAVRTAAAVEKTAENTTKLTPRWWSPFKEGK